MTMLTNRQLQKRITSSTNKEMAELYLKGYSTPQIAEMYLMDKSNVAQRIKSAGVPLRSRIEAARSRVSIKTVRPHIADATSC